MKKRVVTIVVALLWAAPGFAQSTESEGDEGHWSIGAGMGFTASPETFLMNFEAEYHFTDHLSVGPALHVGVASGGTIVSPFANVRYRFGPLPFDNDFLKKFRPHIQGGLGLTYYSFGPGDTGMLLNFGGGLEYMVSDDFALGSRMLFNVLPVDAGGDNFYWSWEIIGARIRF